MSRPVRCDSCGYIEDGTRRLFRVRQMKGEGQLGKPLAPEVDICEGCLGLPLVKVIDDSAAVLQKQMEEEFGMGRPMPMAENLAGFRPPGLPV